MGYKAGYRKDNGLFEGGTVFSEVDKRLREFIDLWKKDDGGRGE